MFRQNYLGNRPAYGQNVKPEDSRFPGYRNPLHRQFYRRDRPNYNLRGNSRGNFPNSIRVPDFDISNYEKLFEFISSIPMDKIKDLQWLIEGIVARQGNNYYTPKKDYLRHDYPSSNQRNFGFFNKNANFKKTIPEWRNYRYQRDNQYHTPGREFQPRFLNIHDYDEFPDLQNEHLNIKAGQKSRNSYPEVLRTRQGDIPVYKNRNSNQKMIVLPEIRGRFWTFLNNDNLSRSGTSTYNRLPFLFRNLIFERVNDNIWKTELRPLIGSWLKLFDLGHAIETLKNCNVISTFTSRVNSRHFSRKIHKRLQESNHEIALNDLNQQIQSLFSSLQTKDIKSVLHSLKIAAYRYQKNLPKPLIWNLEGELQKVIVYFFEKGGYAKVNKDILFPIKKSTSAESIPVAEPDFHYSPPSIYTKTNDELDTLDEQINEVLNAEKTHPDSKMAPPVRDTVFVDDSIVKKQIASQTNQISQTPAQPIVISSQKHKRSLSTTETCDTVVPIVEEKRGRGRPRKVQETIQTSKPEDRQETLSRFNCCGCGKQFGDDGNGLLNHSMECYLVYGSAKSFICKIKDCGMSIKVDEEEVLYHSFAFHQIV